jgi:hypothetical protein
MTMLMIIARDLMIMLMITTKVSNENGNDNSQASNDNPNDNSQCFQ